MRLSARVEAGQRVGGEDMEDKKTKYQKEEVMG